MMFWSRSSNASASSSAPSATAASSSSVTAVTLPPPSAAALARRSGDQAPGQRADEALRSQFISLADDQYDANGLPPSYVLSDQRRQELLAAARTTRASWIDGNTLTNGHNAATKGAANEVPEHCQRAIESINTELQQFMGRLEQLKQHIIPDDVRDAAHAVDLERDNNDAEYDNSVTTILDELRVHAEELLKWQRVYLHDRNGHRTRPSAAQMKRMTVQDKEMLFLSAFEELLAVLKQPRAAELVYQIQLFVKKFEHWNLETMLRYRALQDRPGGHVQAFIDKIVHQLQHQEASTGLFRDMDEVVLLRLEDSEDQLLHEVLEAFLMEKLYTKALTPSKRSEIEDNELRERLDALSFVDFGHLDLPAPTNDEITEEWQSLATQLGSVSMFPSPRRKMDCVLRVCQSLTGLLSRVHGNGRFPSADEFLPGLIYLLLKANPPALQRNVHYILEYRRPSRLVSEPGYFFTHLVSSVAFVEQVNGDLLTITPEEFENGLRQSKERVKAGISSPTQPLSVTIDKAVGSSTLGPHDASDRPEDSVLVLPSVLDIRARRLASATANAV
ncbi:hypothetical protein PINS_up010668 [Pythium insidiosum]|nr:hypothetical protein PINS_up010668 [Pythium insidiosum]